MSAVRIIPRLDVKGPHLVKGIHLEGLRVLGDPEVFAQYYYEQGADELFYMDVVASLFERNSLHQIIQQTSKNIFIPITVGGGIRSLNDIRQVLNTGADKVCINTAAIKNPQFIKEAATEFGSSTIVVAMEAIRQSNGEYLLFTDNAREHTGIEALSWAKKVESLGAGEIILTSVDREGTGDGFDFELIQLISKQAGIPVVAHGGAKNPENIAEAMRSGVSAVAVGSILHYDVVQKIKTIGVESNTTEGNTQFLKMNRQFGKIQPSSIPQIKQHLQGVGIECRT
jgi:cyclase